MIRVAAAADLHFGADSEGTYRPMLEGIEERADVLLVAGDLTRIGDPAEAAVLARELAGLPIPVFAVLGNHDHHLDRAGDVAVTLQRSGVSVLEGEAATLDVDGTRLGIAGVKGFGGGFLGACGSEFGEVEMKAFMRHTRAVSDALERALSTLDVDARIALIHYAPVPDTLVGERPEIYPFLGCYLLGEAVDRSGADLILHGHAHAGTERGVTPGGIPVRNVALPVIGKPYNVYCFGAREGTSGNGARSRLDVVEEASMGSFPASDPPSAWATH